MPGCVLGTQAIVMTRLLLPALRVMVSLVKVNGMHTSQKFNDHGKGNNFPLVSLSFR